MQSMGAITELISYQDRLILYWSGKEVSMSAGNIIYIQENNRKWYVWMGFLSEDVEPTPDENAFIFSDKALASDYALDWANEEYVEYGVRLLSHE